MTTIQPPGWGNKPWNYEPPDPPSEPPPPPPPIYQEMPDGTVREVDQIIVTAQKKTDLYRSLLPYGGLTGAQENARRDMEWAMMSPVARVESSGLNFVDRLDDVPDGDGALQTLELVDADGWKMPTEEELFQLIGGGSNRELTPGTRSDGRGTNLDDYSRALNGLPPRTRWDPNTLSPQNLTSVGTSPARSSPYQRELIGDGVDGMQFASELANSAGFGRN